MSIRIVIIGNGISAQLFMSYLKYHFNVDYSCLVLEKNEKVNMDNMDDVPFYFNRVIDDFANYFIPITVEMGIYDKGDIIYQGNDKLAEKYAMKVLGVYSNNTIRFIEKHHFTTFSKIKERTRRFLMYNKFANKSTRKRVTLYV